MAEKRLEKRHRKRLSARYGVEECNRIGFTEDVSEEGFCLKAAVVFHPGTVLQVEIVSPGGEPIRLRGKVMWAKKVPPTLMHKVKAGMGIRVLSFQRGEEHYRSMCEEMLSRV